jgi:hypothetical protein
MKPRLIDPDALDHFRQVFKGSLIDPPDLRYESSRRVWNGMIDRYPALITQCTDTADVASAIRFARENDLLCDPSTAFNCQSKKPATGPWPVFRRACHPQIQSMIR